jgi:hypothetical protein
MPFDLETLQRGHSERDAELLIDLYAEEAEVVVIDQKHPPSHPRVLEGRQAISGFLHELCDSDIILDVGDVVVGDDRIALHVAWWYPDGTQALSSEVLELDETGHILRETIVQAFDRA